MKEDYEPYTMIQENGGMHHMKHGIGDTSLNITNSLSAGFAFFSWVGYCNVVYRT